MPEHKHPSDVAKRLPSHQDDFVGVTGKPFSYFFCPILHKDEQTELCMGHVINDACPGSFGGRVIQRKDVDGWYGRVFESDFTDRVRLLSMGLEKAIQDPQIWKKIPIRLFAGNIEVQNFPDNGVEVPGQTSVEFEVAGVLVSRKVKKSPEELEALVGDRRIEIGRNDRAAAFVTILKSAFLTMFRELGYAYALSPGGVRLGHDMLGKFFFKYRNEKKLDVIKGVAEFFATYVNMMRAIDRFEGTGKNPVGTVEDGLLNACVTPNGSIFALKVFLRTDDKNYSVLAPYYDSDQGKAAFEEFLVNDCQELTTHKCQLNNKGIIMEERVTRLTWPKNPIAFGFD